MPRSPWLLILLLAACSGDADPGTVTVETDRVCCLGELAPAGTPVAGVDVIAEDPDGTTRTAVTGADGTVTIEIADGGSITAAYRFAGEVAYLYSFLDVAPGDHLRFGDGEYDQAVAYEPTASMGVDVPAFAGATGYRVAWSCGWSYVDSPITHASFDQTAICAPDQDDLYLFAYANGVLLAHGVVRDVGFVAGGNVALDAWVPMRDITVDVTGLPLDASDAWVAVSAVNQGGALYSAFVEDAPQAGGMTGTFPWTADGEAMIASSTVITPTGVQSRDLRLAVDAPSATIADPIGLPWVSGRAFDVANRTLSYQLDADQDGDVTVGHVSYTTTTFPSIYWRLYAPPSHAGENEMVLPVMPTGFEDLEPRTAVTADGSLELRDFDDVDDYDATRAIPIWQLEQELALHGGYGSGPGV